MRIVGVIAEYNPFHLGHAWHLAQARLAAQADYVVVVMSTCFTQRGDAAILPPMERARMALRCGADAVFALPAAWAVRDAEHFALGGVALLKSLGVDAISFGAEEANLTHLSACAHFLETPDPAFTSTLRQRMQAGLSYPAAMAEAAEKHLNGAGALLASPNNMLAICYLRAMLRLNATMEAFPISRQSSYHATSLGDTFPSATALRGALLRGDWAGCSAAMPDEAFHILQNAAQSRRIMQPSGLDQVLLYRLRTMNASDSAALPDISEGIEDRLRSAARISSSRAELLTNLKTRRYPYARLNRLCTHALLGLTDDQLQTEPLPTAAWLLGFRETARPLLSQLKKSGFPIIGKASNYTGHDAWFRTELSAYDLWALGCCLPAGLALTQGVAVER